MLPVPETSGEGDWNSWGLSLGYSLLNGIQQYFMLGANFETHGFSPEKQVPVSVSDDAGPISVADFAVRNDALPFISTVRVFTPVGSIGETHSFEAG